MSRALTSLPIVKPTSSSAGLKTRASSGSGTHQCDRAGPGSAARPDDPARSRLEEQFRPRAPVDPIVKCRRLLRFLLASDLAPLVGHTRTPDLLGIQRRQHLDRLEQVGPTRDLHRDFQSRRFDQLRARVQLKH